MTKNRLYIKSMIIKQVVNTDKDITNKMTYREKHKQAMKNNYKNNEKYRGNKKSKITRKMNNTVILTQRRYFEKCW